jgi:hypothetical protein
MFATSLPTIIGLIAGCLFSWSLVPQLLKYWREGLTEAVFKKMFATQLPESRSEHHDSRSHNPQLGTGSPRLLSAGRCGEGCGYPFLWRHRYSLSRRWN